MVILFTEIGFGFLNFWLEVDWYSLCALMCRLGGSGVSMNTHAEDGLDGPKHTVEAEECGQEKDRAHPPEAVFSKFMRLSFRVRQIWV